LRTYHVTRAAQALTVPLVTATSTDLADWLGAQDWAPATRRSYRGSLVQYFRWLVATGVRVDNPAALLPAIKVPRGLPRPAPEDVYDAALGAADPRARFAMLLAGQCGLRRGEIAGLHSRHVERDLFGYSLRVTGKGGHTRLVPVATGDTLEFLLRRVEPGWLFPSDRGGHLSPEHLGRIVSRSLPQGWTCHTLRHRFATTIYRSTHDIRATQELLGHARPETTAIYTQVAPADLREAVNTAVRRPHLELVRDE
jgi:site-specific recombinase XerD